MEPQIKKSMTPWTNGYQGHFFDLHDQKREVCRVLLIEDDFDFARTVRARLRLCSSLTFEVLHIGCLSQLQTLFQEDVVDIIVLDLGLPGSKGLETFMRVREVALTVPIVVMSGSDDDEVAMKAVQMGAQDYVLKGQEDSGMLVRVLKHSLERHKIKEKLNNAASELMKANCKLENLTRSDPLTDLLNRRGLQNVLSREIQWAKRQNSETSVLLFDLDDFKEVNDRYGYAVGDVLLKEIASRLEGSVRLTDYVARIGGDEFIILLPQTSLSDAMQVAEKVRLAVCGHVITLPLGDSVQVTASIGVAIVNEETPSIDELLGKMHPYLSRSKKGGKNQVSSKHSLEGSLSHDHSIAGVVDELREGRNLIALKQPIMKLDTKEIIGYELLSRFTRDHYKTPDVFFRVSTEHNILTLVDHHCYKACVGVANQLNPQLSYHLNLFPSTLIGVPTQHLLEELGLAENARHFCIEISEQQIIGNPTYLMTQLKMLRKFGLSIAIDDVGFGGSCLENLVHLEPDIIKIDKKCVQGISVDPAQLRVLKRLLKIAEALDADVIAEGIETEEDLGVLRDLGVQFGQGFLLGKPA